jgi:hypothetical protein
MHLQLPSGFLSVNIWSGSFGAHITSGFLVVRLPRGLFRDIPACFGVPGLFRGTRP